MSIDTDKDPIHQTFQAIWDCLEAETLFTTAVPSSNRIKYTSTSRAADKPGLTTVDAPQVRVIQTGLAGQIRNTTSSCTLQVYFAIEVKPGDRRMEKLTEVQWAIYRAMSRWHTYLRDQITWNSTNVFRRLMPLKAETEYAPDGPATEEPEPSGWISVWAGIGELFLQTSAVEAES